MGRMSERCCISCRRSRQATLDRSFPIRIVGGRICRALGGSDRFSPPFAIRLLAWVPFPRRIPTRIIGMGFRPEHVRTPAIKTEDTSGMSGNRRGLSCVGLPDCGRFRDASNQALTGIFSPSSLLPDLAHSTQVRAGPLFSRIILTGVSSLVGRLVGSCCHIIVRWRGAAC
jgi:hypothetical protein